MNRQGFALVHFVDVSGISAYVNPAHVVAVLATGEVTGIMLNAKDTDGKQFMFRTTETETEVIKKLIESGVEQ